MAVALWLLSLAAGRQGGNLPLMKAFPGSLAARLTFWRQLFGTDGYALTCH
jgi:hypothetical protein